MEIKSISGLVFYVKDLDKTAAFYQELGFRFGKRTDTSMVCYVNWFWAEFRTDGESVDEKSGPIVGLNVKDVNEFYKGLLDKGIKPETEPTQGLNGRTEFIVNDPDGYQLLIFQK